MNYEENILKYIKEMSSEKEPGGVVAIVKNNKTIVRKEFGLANMEHNIPINPKSMFYIASVSKQFTAYCIYILEQDGLISFDDNINKFFPELPTYDYDMKIKHLIHHCSGLPDYLTVLDLCDRTCEESFNKKEILDLIKKFTKLQFAPNDKYQYSNTNYFLLGEVIEKISKKSLNEYASEKIFRPLKMYNTFFNNDGSRVIKNKADAYYYEDQEYKVHHSSFNLVGDGGIWSNVEDLEKWVKFSYEENLFRIQSKITKLNDKSINNYGLGQMVGEYEGYKIVHHDGALGCYLSALLNFPEENLSIICLSNNTKYNSSQITRDIADKFIEKKIKAESPLNLMNAEKLKKLIGNYSSQNTNEFIRIFEYNNRLYLSYKFKNVMLFLNSSQKIINQPNSFNWKFEIINCKDSKDFQYKILLDDEGQKFTYTQISPKEPFSNVKIMEYVGRYKSKCFKAFCDLKFEKDKLKIQSYKSWDHDLTFLDENNFIAGSNRLRFKRDEKNDIIGFMLDNPRAINTVFYEKV